MKKEAIVLLNMGGPNNLEEVEVFLTNMFNDKNIITVKSSLLRSFIAKMITFTRTEKAQEIYRRIGGKSPLVGHTKNLVKKLKNRVREGVVVDFAMRYTPPFAAEVIERLNKENIERIYLIPLYPQFSTTTTKSSLEDFEEQYHLRGGDAILIEIKHFFQNINYNKAIIERIKERVDADECKNFDIIFSAHGLPQKIVDAGDIYERHVQKHVEILKQMLKDEGMNFNEAHLAYQSKVGPMEWLKPSLEEKLGEIKSRSVVIFPIAFTIDNSETDFELEIEYREIARELGFEDYRVCRCPNDSELFVEALAEIYAKMR
ncbi:MAG: ferrochelatase [Sulfurimonas sp. RIFCSPHIGHO2_12_FULL_36_9]|uniref:ferrochelatase n=1 Tax=Sulfurimonas sp. RIFCSPLOWO2_12_36_12 TaxID=1802253 RepID=UPI0008C4FDCF|nr:ferrochelatase [Sulfurimonas sp. RIFCSPLOWO2_12_36_12]OHD96296.1 MAG: ferrochelatase [Sulfurimonas sp. RIFCSPHIGHO2_12_FULL_36_9]OHD97250.1 MAG: ferrochelatase [Sulfurimonas sp. RIFCSPLOWO2_02_FULL_36_28]OHE02620.1 MAG: ferrochelatase [Sulfurimonas sp. RIFCSPLOWO2_12_36_12]OHE08112.1 MAG: ferrochelatase [Sulfurimonas sp. RIFCSPLOWO2_12_FULL_36_74]